MRWIWARWHLILAIFADVASFDGEFRREFTNCFYNHDFNKKKDVGSVFYSGRIFKFGSFILFRFHLFSKP
ncbi:hypothetical protein Hanom_Chr09g00795461 [Helianthus anomalus]